MTSLGHDLRPEDRHEASVVVRQTMRRARQNVERLVDLLPAIGYRFDTTADLPVFEPRRQTSGSNWTTWNPWWAPFQLPSGVGTRRSGE